MLPSFLELQDEQEELIRRLKARHRIADCHFLRNVPPQRKAHFILVAMEPSLKWFDDVRKYKNSIRDIRALRNFMYSWEDFILHYACRNYLSPDYYITDISKAAMYGPDASRLRKYFYPEGKELFLKELRVVGRPDTVLVPIGAKSAAFLESHCQGMERTEAILHYSPQAARYRRRAVDEHPGMFGPFCRTRTRIKVDIARLAEAMLAESGVPKDYSDFVMDRLTKPHFCINGSRMELLFTYKVRFEAFRDKYNTSR